MSETNVSDTISITDHKTTRPTVRTRPALHETEHEAEARCYETEAEKFATLVWRT